MFNFVRFLLASLVLCRVRVRDMKRLLLLLLFFPALSFAETDKTVYWQVIGSNWGVGKTHSAAANTMLSYGNGGNITVDFISCNDSVTNCLYRYSPGSGGYNFNVQQFSCEAGQEFS